MIKLLIAPVLGNMIYGKQGVKHLTKNMRERERNNNLSISCKLEQHMVYKFQYACLVFVNRLVACSL